MRWEQLLLLLSLPALSSAAQCSGCSAAVLSDGFFDGTFSLRSTLVMASMMENMYKWRWANISLAAAALGLPPAQHAAWRAGFERRWRLLGATGDMRWVQRASLAEGALYHFEAVVMTASRSDGSGHYVFVVIDSDSHFTQLWLTAIMVPASFRVLGKRTSTWVVNLPGLLAAKADLDAAVDAALASFPAGAVPKIFLTGHSSGAPRAQLYALMLLDRRSTMRRPFEIGGVFAFGPAMLGFSCPDGKPPDLNGNPAAQQPRAPVPVDEVCIVQLYDAHLADKTVRWHYRADIAATMPWDIQGRDGRVLGYGHAPAGQVHRLTGSACVGPLTDPAEAGANCSPLVKSFAAATGAKRSADGCAWLVDDHMPQRYTQALAACVVAAAPSCCLGAGTVYRNLVQQPAGGG